MEVFLRSFLVQSTGQFGSSAPVTCYSAACHPSLRHYLYYPAGSYRGERAGNHRSARIGTALSLPAMLAYPFAFPHLGSAQCMLDLLTSSGNRRSARIATAHSLPAVQAYPCACPYHGSTQRMLHLLAGSGNHRSARSGTALLLPAILAHRALFCVPAPW